MIAREVDLVIVGASFAGLICARSAALRGLKVVVIESKSDPGARIHTTGILVKEAAEEIDTPAKFSRVIHGVRLYSPSLKSIDLRAPGYYFLATDTAGLVRWLADEARHAGAEIICDRKVETARRENGKIVLPQFDIKNALSRGRRWGPFYGGQAL
jgi:digeranylgeranylglycerophospholipid reductase